jgi:hypothetical protein
MKEKKLIHHDRLRRNEAKMGKKCLKLTTFVLSIAVLRLQVQPKSLLGKFHVTFTQCDDKTVRESERDFQRAACKSNQQPSRGRANNEEINKKIISFGKEEKYLSTQL